MLVETSLKVTFSVLACFFQMLFVDLFIVVNRQNLGFVGIGIT